MNESRAPLPRIGAPVADNEARAVIHAIGGYAYQLICTALAWIDLEPGASLQVSPVAAFDWRPRLAAGKEMSSSPFADLSVSLHHAVEIDEAVRSGHRNRL